MGAPSTQHICNSRNREIVILPIEVTDVLNGVGLGWAYCGDCDTEIRLGTVEVPR